jgi:putative addiction module component (TIGR02574 family)
VTIMMPVDVDSLSVEARLDLITKLWNSIDRQRDIGPLPEEKRLELERRLASYRANPSHVESLEDIESDLDSICGD